MASSIERWGTIAASGCRAKVPDEQRQVFDAVAERRNGDFDRANAIVEIAAERVLLDGSFEIAIRGEEVANVDRELVSASHGPHGAPVQHAKELSLQRQWKLRDLIEEERASVSLVEKPAAVRVRSREGSGSMAEQLRFEEIRWQSCAVDRQKPAVATGAHVVDGARGDLLAGFRSRR